MIHSGEGRRSCLSCAAVALSYSFVGNETHPVNTPLEAFHAGRTIGHKTYDAYTSHKDKITCTIFQEEHFEVAEFSLPQPDEGFSQGSHPLGTATRLS